MAATRRSWPLLRRGRRLLDLHWGRVLAGLLLVILIGGYFVLQPASNTAFSISANTDQLLVEPLCDDQMLWDLPAGHVLPISAPPEASQCSGAAASVTIGFRGGARALLTSRTGGQLDVHLSPGTLAGKCHLPTGRNVMSVQVNDTDLPADAQGYIYRSGECKIKDPPEGGGAKTQTDGAKADSGGVLTVSGRLQIGAAIPEGAGWGNSAVAVSLLRQGEILARHAAPFTHERMTLLEEKLDPGSIVDTIPCLAESAPDRKDCLASAITTPGFVRLTKDGLDVQAYPTREVGVTPHRGEQRRINLTRWDILKYSPFAQLLAALFGVLLLVVDVPDKLRKLKGLFELRANKVPHP